MRIAQIAPPWIAIPPKNYGGTENVIYNQIEAEVALGHDVTLFAPGDAKTSAKLIPFFPQSLTESDVPWNAHLKAYYHLHKSIAYIQEHAYDFDIVHTRLSSSADMYVLPLAAALPIPHVTTLHSHFPFDRMGNWAGDADEYYIKEWASRIPLIAISESAREAAPPELNFVGVVHHGLCVENFLPTIKQQGNYFAWLGRFEPEKGAHLAIQAAKEAGVALVLAGIISRNSQSSMNYFHNVIKPQVDNEQIKYIGPVNMKQKIDLLSRAQGFLNPIEWEEPFGMVMIEAMALGCPVISFARGAAPEIVIHHKTGFLVQNVDEMVHFIPRIGEIDRNITRMHIEENFSARSMAEGYIKIYKEVIKTSKGSPKVAIPQAKIRKPLVPATPALVNPTLPVQTSYHANSKTREVESKPKPAT